jgi:hypothetical protein
VDQGLPILQGKAKRVTSSELIALLQEFHRDKVALRERHLAGARQVSHYDYNNTYQYIINREDAQIAWLQQALTDMGAAPPDYSPTSGTEGGSRDQGRRGRGEAAERAVVDEDVRQQQAFIDTWRGRVGAMAHARHRKMLNVILGESVEHLRFFQQMTAGRDDVLGRRTGGRTTGGGVLPVRWLRP